MIKGYIISLVLLITNLFTGFSVKAQAIPSSEENIPYLVTFGGQSEKKWGDDDFCGVFFIAVPSKLVDPIYIRVYDPDCGGDIDEPKGAFDTKTSFTVYGGKNCFTDTTAQGTDPTKNYKSGNLLATKTFTENPKYNNEWYSFGPFNPTEGELVPEYGGYIFKIIAQGVSGDDGNLYKYFISTSNSENKAIEGLNSFSYEYTFRMHDNPNNISHIYPYIDDKVISIKITNFDWDNDGIIRIVSVSKNGVTSKVSGEGNWVTSTHEIVNEEKNTSLDIQFIKAKNTTIKNNNVVIYVRNQYGKLLPFYVAPIGGIPKFKGKVIAKKITNKK